MNLLVLSIWTSRQVVRTVLSTSLLYQSSGRLHPLYAPAPPSSPSVGLKDWKVTPMVSLPSSSVFSVLGPVISFLGLP